MKSIVQKVLKIPWYVAADVVLGVLIVMVGIMLLIRGQTRQERPVLGEIQGPDWYTQDFLAQNPYSRPGTVREEVNNIVIHYVANPGTSARQNWNYFQSLANQQGEEEKVYASSHYIIGLDGEILQCIPLEEVAYANYPRNEDTISIECCHPDETGEFTAVTKSSLVRLTAWLCEELGLTEKDVIRHYDVIEKNCPKYYVEHEDAWKGLLKEIKKARKELRKRKES